MVDVNYSNSRISYDTHNKNLINFSAKYIITKKDENYDQKINFCNVLTKTNYHIPPNKIQEFMDLLNKCRIHNIPLNFTEYQQKGSLEDRKGSGIFLDFDLYFANDKDTLNRIVMLELIQEIAQSTLDILDYKLAEFNDEEVDNDELALIMEKQIFIMYAVVLRKENVEFDEKKQLYKNGFHILLPNILVAKEVKKYFINKLYENKKIKKLIEQTGLVNPHDFLDKNSAHVPHVLFGSSKVGKIPYVLYNVSKTTIKKSGIIYPLDITSDFMVYNTQGSLKKSKENESNINNINLIHEFNLNYRSNFIKHRPYVHPKKSIIPKINLHDEQIPDENSNEIEKYIEELEQDINMISCDVTDFKYVKGLLECLSIDRLTDYGKWRDVIYALANTSPHNYKLALWASARAKEAFDKKSVDELWNQAINQPSKKKTLTKKSLYFWAKQDNPTRVDELEEISVFNQINQYIHDKTLEGKLNHYEFAKFIFIMFREKFKTDKVNGSIAWFEFVTDSSDYIEHGEIFKWRELLYIPKPLSMFISEKLKNIITSTIEDLEKKIESSEGEVAEIKYYQKLIKNVRSSAQKLSCANFKTGVFKELQVMFQESYFTSKLNLDINIIGVGNGILVLDQLYPLNNGFKTPKLIKGCHEFRISNFTEVDYVPYDPESIYVQKIEQLIDDLFPPDEADAKNFIMHYLASSLDGNFKESLLLICCGNGCHSINSPIMMYDGSIKKVQDVRLNDKVMGDDNTPRIVQRLYRGTDTMVRINPIKEKSFIVNIDHVLSLKFTNLIIVNKRTDGYYANNPSHRVIWYEYNGINEPKRKSKMIKNINDVNIFKDHLRQNKNIIQKGDIIDIKVKDLLKWNSWWLTKGNVTLYKNDKITFNEKKLNLDPYLLGYWLGDGTSCRPEFTTMETEVINEYKNKLPNHEIIEIQTKGQANTYKIKAENNLFKNGLEYYNLLNNKHIPFDFKTASITQRLELLAGIIDSDGHYQESMNQYELTLKDEELFDDCLYVCKSLGFICFKNQITKTCTNAKDEPKKGLYFRMQIYGDGIETIPCRLSRKVAIPRIKNKNASMDGFNIEILEKDNYYGFELDQNHRYITGDGFVHHNSNGKSFLMDFLNNILGSHYSKKISMDFFTGGRGKSSTADPEAMSLINKRFAYCSESGPDDKINVEKVKEYTGHERLSFRGLYKDQINARLNCNFTIITNHMPKIETFDHGSWRRFLIYNFKYKFVETKPDPNNKYEKKMDKDVSNKYKEDSYYQQAFLSILVQYYISLQEKYNGDIKKVPHKTLVEETLNYRNVLDHTNKFLSSVVVFNKSEKIHHDIIELVDSFKVWFEYKQGMKFVKGNNYIIDSFCNSVIKNNIIKDKNDNYKFYGLRIVDNEDDIRDDDIPIV